MSVVVNPISRILLFDVGIVEHEVINVIPPNIAVQGGGPASPASTLQATPGTWDGSPVLTYQWYNSNGIILGETGMTYEVQDTDAGYSVYVREIPNGDSGAGVNSNSIEITGALLNEDGNPLLTEDGNPILI